MLDGVAVMMVGQLMTRVTRLSVVVLCIMVMTACGWRGVPQVKTGPAAPPGTHQDDVRLSQMPDTHSVKRGETLYQIAFRYELAVDDLARWNAIGPPYTIYPDQQLRLQSRFAEQPQQTLAKNDGFRDAGLSTQPLRSPASAAGKASEARDLPAVDTGSTASIEKPEVRPALKPTLKIQPLATAAKPQPKPAATAAVPEKVSNAGVDWMWPVAGGRLNRRFISGDQSRQGIDISGNPGQPVLAAADGEVVYSGSGLLGFSELIIVKHNDSLLSAYAHNRRRLVKEGDSVNAGQQIAELGQSPRGEDEVHVQIRKKGKPQDPLIYLPDQ